MANDDSEHPNTVVQAAQGPGSEESSPRICKENDTDMNQPQPSNPPETPTLPPGATLNGTRAPEPMGLPERHQSALRHIRTLEAHNEKLYEDNCRLVNTVNMLNDRLALFGAPPSTQVLRLADMQEKLCTSEANRAVINRKYQELLQYTSVGSAPHHIGEELLATREAYASLDREYRLLRDKYIRLKAVTDVSQGTVRGLIPIVRSESATTTQFRAHDQSRNSLASPTTAISPGSFQPFLDERGNHRRRSSEGVMAQPSLRSGPTPIATTWLAPLPTPPPSAPLFGAQISPTGFRVHAPAPAGSLPLAHHPQITHDPRALSGLPAVTQSRHLVQQGVSEQHKAAIPGQRGGEITDTTNNEPVPCGKQSPAPALLNWNPRPPKRPNSELPTSPVLERKHKSPRIEGEADGQATIDADPCSANKTLSPPASTYHHEDRKLTVPDSDVRSYQDCVNLIFEKDADVENGVFCGLCFDRHEAKMIPEPPDVLVQPEFDFLVRHCMTMHPAVWDDLRRKA